MEKVFKFNVATSSDDVKEVLVKESELTDVQIEMLMGELYYIYNGMPQKVKDKIKFVIQS